MSVNGIYGNAGSGKTVLAVHLLSHEPNIKIYGNVVSIKLPNYEMLDSIDLFDLERTEIEVTVLWDEGYTEMENRRSMRIDNIVNSYLLMQRRKRNFRFIGISPLNILDVRWRSMEHFAIYAYDRPIKNEDGSDYKGDFHYFITDGRHKQRFTLPYNIAKECFKYFDTKEIISPKDLEKIRENIEISQDKEKLNELIDDYVEKLKKIKTSPDFIKPTKYWVKDNMLRLGLNMKLCDFVWIRINQKQ
jgi:ABC-type dipeptide/oligopeptide/nickel transport system ATPase component